MSVVKSWHAQDVSTSPERTGRLASCSPALRKSGSACYTVNYKGKDEAAKQEKGLARLLVGITRPAP